MTHSSATARGNRPPVDALAFAALSLLGLAVRLPYFLSIPRFEDETLEALSALAVWPGRQFVTYGWDNYIGPLYSYLVGGLYFVFGLNPALPRVLMVVLGALTVGLTYALARALNLSRPVSLLAAAVLLANPAHVLVSSHIAWSNSMIAFFTTGLLLTLALAVQRDQPRWLLAAGALAGLALQAHPVVGIFLPGVALWFVLEPKTRGWLRTPWPYLAALTFLAVYGVVIYHNLFETTLSGVGEAQSRGYLWQTDPTPATYVSNLWRLVLQLALAAAGVLGDAPAPNSPAAFVVMLYAAWLAAGIAHGLRARLWMPLCIVASPIVIMPYFTNHYGTLVPTRLTNHFTPLFAILMSAFAVALAVWAGQRVSTAAAARPALRRALVLAVVLVFVAAALYPLDPLARYYRSKNRNSDTNDDGFAFAALVQQEQRNAPVYLSLSLNKLALSNSSSVAFVSDYLLTMAQIPHQTLRPGEILEHLTTRPGRTLLVLAAEDVPFLSAYAPLVHVDAPANQTAAGQDYGLYVIEDGARISRPDFVFAPPARPPAPGRPVDADSANFAGLLALTGYDLAPGPYHPGDTLELRLHWRALGRTAVDYVGFVHFVGRQANPASGQRLWSQDDHELGHGVYRTHVWQAGETVLETYRITVPADAPAGAYELLVGVYEPVSVQRLPLAGAQGDVVTLGTVEIAP